MGKVITLEDILHLYGPEEPISISIVLSPELEMPLYKGTVEDAHLEKYKDKEVRSIKTSFVEDGEKKDLSPDLQEEDCQEERGTYIELNNTEPEEGFDGFGYEFGTIGPFIGDIWIVDVKTTNTLYEGPAKKIPTDLANSLWYKASLFSDYAHMKNHRNIYLFVVE